jgi:hypothetical protein
MGAMGGITERPEYLSVRLRKGWCGDEEAGVSVRRLGRDFKIVRFSNKYPGKAHCLSEGIWFLQPNRATLVNVRCILC